MVARALVAVLVVLALLALPLPVHATGADLQARLAKSPAFLSKVENLIMSYAVTVKNESTVTPNHAARAAYADQVLSNSASHAISWAVLLSGSTNVVAAGITNNDDGTVSSPVTDAAMLSQIASLWNLRAVAG